MKLIPPTVESPDEESAIAADAAEEQVKEDIAAAEGITRPKTETEYRLSAAGISIQAIQGLARAGESFIETLVSAMTRIEESNDATATALALTAFLQGGESMITGLISLMIDGQQGAVNETGSNGHQGRSRQASAGNRKVGRRSGGTTANSKTTGRRPGRPRKAAVEKPTAAQHRANLRASARKSPKPSRNGSRAGGRKGAVKKGGKKR